MPNPQNQPPMIALRGITKAFPFVLANDHIDLDIFNAEIHALLGENGAGKSTLMKILFGFYRADAGEILMEWKTDRHPLAARRTRRPHRDGLPGPQPDPRLHRG